MLPISGFNNNTIFAAYKTQFEFLESKGHKIRSNVMDNQCTKQIKKFFTAKDCNLLLVEPHNHRVNAAERVIQTFKDHFISALATTDSKFPTATMGQACISSREYTQLDASIAHRPGHVGL